MGPVYRNLSDFGPVRPAPPRPSAVGERIRAGLGSEEQRGITSTTVANLQPHTTSRLPVAGITHRGSTTGSFVAVDRSDRLPGSSTSGIGVFRHAASLPELILPGQNANAKHRVAGAGKSPSPATNAAVAAATLSAAADAEIDKSSAGPKRVDGRLGPRIVRVTRPAADPPSRTTNRRATNWKHHQANAVSSSSVTQPVLPSAKQRGRLELFSQLSSESLTGAGRPETAFDGV